MQDHFNQIAKRYGVVNKVVSVPNHPANDDEIVRLYEEQITPKTKLMMVCHMINITGHILPIQKILSLFWHRLFTNISHKNINYLN